MKKAPRGLSSRGLWKRFAVIVAGSQISAHHASAPEANEPQPKKQVYSKIELDIEVSITSSRRLDQAGCAAGPRGRRIESRPPETESDDEILQPPL